MKMNAAIHQVYGPPEVLKIMEIPKPIPSIDEILLKVHSSTVNRTDAGFRSAEYFISRFWSGLLKPKQQTLGCEFAGEIESVGSAIKSFKIGDKILGFNDKKFGGHAEYMVLKESDAITIMPENLSFDQAAALTEGAHYALVNIRAANVQPGQNVLVYGATGAIGSAAVQLLHYFGAKVTAVCATQNVELVKSLGADFVIDYLTKDFTKTTTKFEFIFDAVGKSSFRQCKPLLSNKGIYISTELGKNGVNLLLALVTPIFKGKKLLFPIPLITKKDVEFLALLARNEQFKPLIDSSYSLDQIIDAYKYVESGKKIGNVILKIVKN